MKGTRPGLLMASVALLLAACTAACADSCGSRKCGGPPNLPNFAVHLSINGKLIPPGGGGSRALPIKIGRPTRLSVSIDRARDVPVSNLYLVVNSYPWGIDRGEPSGKVNILAHHAAFLSPDERVEATWIAQRLFGTTKLAVSVDFTIGSAGTGMTLANLELVQ